MEPHEILRFLMAFLFIMALMGGLWLALKRLGLNGPLLIQTPATRRLRIVEILPLDARRKAILLRRDDKEHLVILGATGETVVESGITVQEAHNDIKTV